MKDIYTKYKHLVGMGLLAAIFMLGSCESALEVEADNSLSGDVLNSATMQDALMGAYVNLMGIYDGAEGGELLGGDFQLMATLLLRSNNTEISWDEIEAPDYEDFIDKDIQTVNARVEANWRRAYETINSVNAILENIDKVSNQAERERIEGEALAIRGILYFELARFWGPQYISGSAGSDRAVPLILNSINDVNDIETPTKATVAAVYAQAITDLEAASGLLQGVNTNNRISYYACQAYLARIALQQNDFVAAEGYLNTVINSGNFSLENNIMAAFNQSAISPENILVVLQNASSNTGSSSTRTGLVAHVASIPKVGFSAMRILPESLNSTFLNNNPKYSDIDERRVLFDGVTSESTLSSVPETSAYYNDPVNTLTISTAKYLNPTGNIPLIRLAEMYLSRAEAILEQNFVGDPIPATALADLNAVRTRSGLPALSDTLTAQEFYDSLVVERNRELIYEGILLHDVKRWAALNLHQTPTIQFQDPLLEKFMLPIPQAECDASDGLCD